MLPENLALAEKLGADTNQEALGMVSAEIRRVLKLFKGMGQIIAPDIMKDACTAADNGAETVVYMYVLHEHFAWVRGNFHAEDMKKKVDKVREDIKPTHVLLSQPLLELLADWEQGGETARTLAPDKSMDCEAEDTSGEGLGGAPAPAAPPAPAPTPSPAKTGDGTPGAKRPISITERLKLSKRRVQ